MSTTMRLAVPTVGEGGLHCERSAHFGHCDCFTVIDVVDGEIGEVRVVGNPPHGEGGCLRPVGILAAEGVNALLAAGMGPRPLQGFNDAGISVFFEDATPDMAQALQLLLDGDVPVMELRQSCGGGEGGCHH